MSRTAEGDDGASQVVEEARVRLCTVFRASGDGDEDDAVLPALVPVHCLDLRHEAAGAGSLAEAAFDAGLLSAVEGQDGDF